VFKNRDWFVLGAVGAVALLLAYWGFSGCVGANCTPEPAWKVFEKSLHLVQGRGSFSIGTDPWQLVVAQYLVPGVAVLAAAKLFLLSLRRDLRVAFARKSSNHTVVCGLSETGLHIVENLRNAGERVVAIDLDSETPAAASCAHAGVPVLKGDATNGKILRLAGAHRAKAIVATTGSDSTNLEISLRANDLGNTRRLVALPELRASWLRNAIANHQRAALGSTNVEVRPFNISDNCARLLYRSPALARRRISFAFAPPRILLLGFGETGEAIVEQGLRTAFAVPGELPEFLVVDEHASDRLSSCETRLPGLSQVAAVRCIDLALSPDPHSWTALNDLVAAERTDAVIVALGADELNLSIASHIRRRLDRDKQLTTPVFVEVRQIRRLGEFTSRLEHIGPLTQRMIPFGELAYLTSMPIVFENRIDDLARAYHSIYLASHQSDRSGNSPAELPWERLPELYKQSSRRFADHINAKMRASGLRLRPSKTPRRLDFSPSEIERLAECEHWRWLVEHRLSGWQRGEQRDESRLLHPHLVSWADLPEHVRELNRAVVRKLPDLLASVGIEVRRERALPAVDSRGIALATERLQAPTGHTEGEHLVIVLDPLLEASHKVIAMAQSAEDTSIWLLLREKMLATLAHSPENETAINVEGWLSEKEFAAMTNAPPHAANGAPHERAAQPEAATLV
jgi:voltage-gated potassium channel Kch